MSDSNLEILFYELSPLGLLCLRRRELLSQPGTIVTEVTLNHEFLMSSLYTDSERVLARAAMQMHEGEDLRVLVGGLGLGYTAHETLLADRVEVVEVAAATVADEAIGVAGTNPMAARCAPSARRLGPVYRIWRLVKIPLGCTRIDG